MNALAEKYGDKLNILAFPCNQFGKLARSVVALLGGWNGPGGFWKAPAGSDVSEESEGGYHSSWPAMIQVEGEGSES